MFQVATIQVEYSFFAFDSAKLGMCFLVNLSMLAAALCYVLRKVTLLATYGTR